MQADPSSICSISSFDIVGALGCAILGCKMYGLCIGIRGQAFRSRITSLNAQLIGAKNEHQCFDSMNLNLGESNLIHRQKAIILQSNIEVQFAFLSPVLCQYSVVFYIQFADMVKQAAVRYQIGNAM